MLPQPGALPLAQGDDGIGGRLRGGVEAGLGIAQRHMRPVDVPLEGEQSARREQGEIGGRRARVGAVLAEGRHRDEDQARVVLPHLRVAQPQFLQVARGERLHQHIGRTGQCQQPFAVAGVVQVQHHALLAQRHGGPVQRRSRMPVAGAGPGPEVTALGALRRLDGDHFGAQVGQQPATELEMAAGQINHPDTVQGRVARW